MSPTLDERATVNDPRYTQHVARSAFLLAVHRAIELDGMPAPSTIGFDQGNIARLLMDKNATADVDDWAAHLGVPAVTKSLGICRISTTAGDLTTSDDLPEWHGYHLYVWCIVGGAK